MSYIESSLMNGEKIVYQGRVSLWPECIYLMLGGSFVISGLLGLTQGGTPLAVMLGVAFLAPAAIRYCRTEIAITNKRLIAKTGLIARSTIEINSEKVESLQVNQGIFGRMLNFGDIVVSGAGNPQAPIRGISAPMEFRRQFFQQTDSVALPQ